MEIYIN